MLVRPIYYNSSWLKNNVLLGPVICVIVWRRNSGTTRTLPIRTRHVEWTCQTVLATYTTHLIKQDTWHNTTNKIIKYVIMPNVNTSRYVYLYRNKGKFVFTIHGSSRWQVYIWKIIITRFDPSSKSHKIKIKAHMNDTNSNQPHYIINKLMNSRLNSEKLFSSLSTLFPHYQSQS